MLDSPDHTVADACEPSIVVGMAVAPQLFADHGTKRDLYQADDSEEVMSSSAIFVIVVVTVILLAILTYMTIYGIIHSRVGRTARAGKGDIETARRRPLKIVLATDGSACSDRAVQSVAIRPWPRGSQVELVSVIHTNVPFVPEPTMMGVAGYEQALEADRQDAPVRVQRAQRFLNRHSALPVATTILEGNPGHLIIQEADRWKADFIDSCHTSRSRNELVIFITSRMARILPRDLSGISLR